MNTKNKTAGKTATKHYAFMERGTDEPDESFSRKNEKKVHWTEDPEQEFKCEKCGMVWTQEEAVSCPRCEAEEE